ncbi:hypothetical protein [Oryzomonas rubra]|uniref:Uncharacterized protein n=1 Tax=Oryzomonas rubra TaxID=2509454 RepID=A0A5A9X6E1_9BACT|nr:hypothetical protein [Oryzomonas rubra]KAA0888742.1 hypothetical protein ET418_15290 [Oryzomonas rubra]
MTKDQIQQLTQMIQDRYAYVAAQFQSEDYHPDPQQLERWKQMGLVPEHVTAETFTMSIPPEMHLLKNAFIAGRLYEAVDKGATLDEVMQLALNMPLKKPDLEAIAIAEQQTAAYITDNASDLATKIGQIAIQKRNETIRQMAVDYHSRTLKRTVLDEEAKREAGEQIPQKYVETWQQFKSELHQAMEDKSRDWDRVAFYEITDAQRQGQAHALLQDGDVDKLVYKMPLPTACPQCKYLYLLPDGKTPRLFRLSDMINNGTNIGRKPHPVKGGQVQPGGRNDGVPALKAVVGLVHPWCQCQGVYAATGYEPWLTDKQKRIIASQKK